MDKAKIQGELWGKSPNGWAEVQEPKHKPLWEAMLDAGKVGKETIFLDAGCGAGGASMLASLRGAKIHGIDVAEGLLAIANRRLPNANFQVADIEYLPFEDDTFDVVFAANSIQYAEDRIAALKELKRVCKPTGRIVAGLFGPPERVEFKAVFEALGSAMPTPPKGGGPFELSSQDKFEKLFEKADLNIVETGEINCPFEYENFETFWYGNLSAGPIQGMLNAVDEGTLKSAVKSAINDFMRDDGSILIEPNIYKYVSVII